jgi:hypothetical protein
LFSKCTKRIQFHCEFTFFVVLLNPAFSKQQLFVCYERDSRSQKLKLLTTYLKSSKS